MRNKLRRAGGPRATSIALVVASMTFIAGQPQAQQATAPGQAINPPVFPLIRTIVPDVNVLGLLDKTGLNASSWPQITNEGQTTDLQQLGKALFWDMQVGGDGIQACATCHYHAGADHRRANQMSPGLKAGDTAHDLIGGGPNSTLIRAHFGGAGSPIGLPVSEAALILAGATPDIAPGGEPGTVAKAAANLDVNDVVSSQGVRKGTHVTVSPPSRVDTATLATEDPGFNFNFSANADGIPDTVRRVEPRNAPTVLNAVYNFRNFWDGRADAFFNGVNPLGFRDPTAMVKTRTGEERLNIPFSSLASQAVGPIESDMEMVFSKTDNTGGRAHRQLGKKLVGATPLAGQLVKCDDSLLGALVTCAPDADGVRGLPTTYGAMISQIFDSRFLDDGETCFDEAGASAACGPETYTLTEWNFSLFFGLAVQAYEATLTTEDTIVDLIVGGKATGTLTNGTGRNQKVVNTAGLPLEACILNLALGNRPAQQAVATDLCTAHYAKFIHPNATTGTESGLAPNPVAAGQPIGGCANPPACTSSPNLQNARATLLNVDRGMGRFFAGATACSVCHFNPEFTGATVQAITGFGAGPVGILPPGQVKREIEAPVVMERMVTFNGLPAVYDAGFYNLGVRPTPEDISLGGQIGGVPLAFSKLADAINGGDLTGLDDGKIDIISTWLANGTMLRLPTSPTDLTPVPWQLGLACGPGLNNPNANNNPVANCVPNVIPGERLLRNGAFKAQGLRNVKFTGPYLHNGAKMNLRQVLEFYKTAGHFPTLNLANLDAGMRIFNLGVADEAAVVEFMETGLTDWRVAHEQGKFDHPEICIPNGHDPETGKTRLAGIPAVGAGGNVLRLQTFEEHLQDTTHEHDLTAACTVPDIVDTVTELSEIDVPPAPRPAETDKPGAGPDERASDPAPLYRTSLISFALSSVYGG